jgi:hypothetical protein
MSKTLIARRAVALLVFAGALVLAVHLIGDLNRVKTLKTDLGEIENVRYGLLDADQWVSRISAILERRINGFELTDANRPQVKQAVERVLNAVLVEVDRYLRQRNQRPAGSWVDQLRGALQQGVQDLLIDFDDLHRKVPQYADLVVEQLGRPEIKREIKAQLIAFLQQAADSTFAKTDRSRLQALLAEYGCADAQACGQLLGERIAAARLPVLQQLAGLFALVGLLFLTCLSPGSVADRPAPDATAAPLDGFQLFLLTGATLILLAGGILTPMIEIEARIAQLSLEVLGEPVTFTNQVLYFQTKSVFDVMEVLVRTRGPDMILVAVLLVAFSVIFPALKVLATYVYYYDFRGLRHNSLVHFFALKSAKWSMADVMVIAIFMAYIGFSGLVGSELGSLRRANTALEVLTTNGTTLAPGFFLFLGFVLASLLVSAIVENRIGEGHST